MTGFVNEIADQHNQDGPQYRFKICADGDPYLRRLLGLILLREARLKWKGAAGFEIELRQCRGKQDRDDDGEQQEGESGALEVF